MNVQSNEFTYINFLLMENFIKYYKIEQTLNIFLNTRKGRIVIAKPHDLLVCQGRMDIYQEILTVPLDAQSACSMWSKLC